MAYRISYGPEVPKQFQKRRSRLRLQVMTAGWLLVFALVVRLFFPAGSALLRQCLQPEPENITQKALNGFVAALRQGETVGDAIYTFCESVIQSDPAIGD